MATWESSTLKDTKQPQSWIITPLTQLQRLHTQVFLISNDRLSLSLTVFIRTQHSTLTSSLLELILFSCSLNGATPQWEILEQLSCYFLNDATVELNGFAQDAVYYSKEKHSAVPRC